MFVDKNTINILSLDPNTTNRPEVVLYGDTDSVFTSLQMDTYKQKFYWIDTAQ